MKPNSGLAYFLRTACKLLIHAPTWMSCISRTHDCNGTWPVGFSARARVRVGLGLGFALGLGHRPEGRPPCNSNASEAQWSAAPAPHHVGRRRRDNMEGTEAGRGWEAGKW